MYTRNVKAIDQDDTMVAKNSLGRIRQLDAHKAARVLIVLMIWKVKS